MFFRPNYCANCGEKIERANWGVFTSRRFCQVCESEYKGQDLIPRVIVGLGIAVGLFGFGSYLKSAPGDEVGRLSSVQPRRLMEHQNGSKQIEGSRQTSSSVSDVSSPARDPNVKNVPGHPPPTIRQDEREPVTKTVSAEPAYICGAETKKGTPCSRRVRGKIRCFQHAGMPAMQTGDEKR